MKAARVLRIPLAVLALFFLGVPQAHAYLITVGLSSAEEPSQWYSMLEYTLSDAVYKGTNYDQGSAVHENIYASHLEGSFGHWFSGTAWGFRLDGELSGYGTQGKIITYNDATFLLGYRLRFRGGGRLRFWFGAGYNELPEILADPANPSAFTVENIRNAGPKAKLQYVSMLSRNWGWQIVADGYYSYWDRGTPTGEKQIRELSYDGGVALSCKFTDRSTGVLGYKYRVENAAYQSSVVSGSRNTVNLTGHYVSLVYEFSLGRPRE